MRQELAFEFARVTENAALAACHHIGRGDKNEADNAAVQAMRTTLNQVGMRGEIVIGEGEIDQAPMLYIGEQVGNGYDDPIDIAVDPIDGTRMTASGQPNALSVILAAPRGALLKAPDMYMEKLATGAAARGAFDLDRPLKENLEAIARALGKPLHELSLITLDKPRHKEMIEELRQWGVRVHAIPDGDICAALLTCLPGRNIDVMYGIGGAPEGVIGAGVVSALGGDFQGRLVLRSQAKGHNAETAAHDQQEQLRCREMGLEPNVRLTREELVLHNDTVFSATGITQGDILAGVERQGRSLTTETVLIQGRTGTIRRIVTTHNPDCEVAPLPTLKVRA